MSESDRSSLKVPSSPDFRDADTSMESEPECLLIESSPFVRSESSNLESSFQYSEASESGSPIKRKRRRLFCSSFEDASQSVHSARLTEQEQGSFNVDHDDSIQGSAIPNENISDETDPTSTSELESVDSMDNTSITSSLDVSSASESDTDNDSGSDEDLRIEKEALYENSTVTLDEAVLGLCDVYVKNRITKTALADFLKYTAAILPNDSAMPRTLKELFSFITGRAPPVQEIPHMYCPECFTVKTSREDECASIGCTAIGGNFFYELPLAEQIKFLFEKRGLAFAVEQFNKSRIAEDGVIKDVLDGSEIKKLKEVYCNPYDLTLLWNSDGISLGDSIYHLWPVLFTFCEIPPCLRAHFICVSMVWYEKREPPMATFLQPFVKSLIEIERVGGVVWTHPISGEKITSRVIAPVAVADAPARASMQNTKRFNGINGCNNCEITCQAVMVNDKKRYYYVYDDTPAELRTGRRMKKQGEQASTVRGGSVKGVKGISPLYPVPHLDVGKFVFPEYMHSVLLGVVLTFTSLMICFDDAWRLKKHLKDIDKQILAIEVPDFLKIPQCLSQIKKYKAHELRAWLLYFSLPILSNYLPEKYFQHWLLLVGAIYLLLQEKISENDLKRAEVMLRMFVRDVETLYSKTAYKYNTHQLLHLVLTVRRWGPLWAISAFIFESFNGVISRMIHGTKHKAKELVKNLKVASGVMALKFNVNGAREAQQCTAVLGNEVTFCFSESELLKITDIISTPFKVFYRVKVGKSTYTSKDYDVKVKRCNSFVIVDRDHQDEVAQCVCFLKSLQSEDIWCYVDIYRVDHIRFFVHNSTRFQIGHIIPIMEHSEERILLPISKLKKKVIKVQHFVCVSPNSVEMNL